MKVKVTYQDLKEETFETTVNEMLCDDYCYIFQTKEKEVFIPCREILRIEVIRF